LVEVRCDQGTVGEPGADEEHESGEENARAPSDCDESHDVEAAYALESRIANHIQDRPEAGNKANIKPKIIARGTRMVLPLLCRISGSLTTGS
jgi:hypothetical protein